MSVFVFVLQRWLFHRWSNPCKNRVYLFIDCNLRAENDENNWLVPFLGLPQWITAFHFNLFSVSSTLTLATCMSSLTASINLLFSLPLPLLPGSSISSILLPMYPLSLLCTCPNHLNLASLVFSPNIPVCVLPALYCSCLFHSLCCSEQLFLKTSAPSPLCSRT